MSGTFRVAYDAPSRLARITMAGFWTEAVLHAFVAEVAQLHASVTATGNLDPGGGRLLLDLHDFPVQSAAIIGPLAALVPRLTESVGRIAVIASPSALSQLQLARALNDPRAKFVDTEVQAHGWLLNR